ncbi:hypothetical protein JY651_26170 [Pyxidicoccus parkwayensis]|uniref:ATP-binding protein n=1 Tax=Pyxidicoccus parkwayensis TaxID=2813578 RepID=A0ABX7NMU8_9BACT|nr:hypothetical protein [Pyxidicoccus parkwaysis]QSQ18847.1 hypothetical protein JY651_26170 [Pyxidicoccus parkwaysis]
MPNQQPTEPPRLLPRARPEAQPYRWSELDHGQQQVARFIHQWMLRFVKDEPVVLPPQGPFTWQAADLQRPSNVLLIHGGRGSGKTSVMLTLLEIWRRTLMEGLECPGAAPGGRGKEAEAGLCDTCISEDGSDVRSLEYLLAGKTLQETLGRDDKPGLIIPLKPLDLQPLPRTASLLTWIASRICEFANLLEQLATGTLEGVSPQPIASWHPESRNEAPWHKPWREFATAAAYGWESNLDQRRGSLDPESFAEELTQAERSRHDVVFRWRAFVSAVVKYACQQFPRTIKGKARLVLPIDDVDMNPNRCVEVLELVRFLWHPQLVFMLTGQSRLFVKMLRVTHHGLMRGGLGSGGLNRSEFKSLDARPSAHELAVQAYDRVIPPGQRFVLAPLTPDLRLHHLVRLLRASLLDKSADPPELPQGASPMEAWLGELEGPGLGRLATFLRRFHQQSLLQVALPEYFRRIRNLEQSLVRETSRNEGMTEPELVSVLWKDAIENQSFSRASDKGLRHAIQFSIIEGAGGTWERKLRVSLYEPIRQRGLPHARFLRAEGDTTLRYELNTANTFCWKVRRDFPREVPDHLTALLLVAINVAADGGGELEGRYRMDGLSAPHVRVSVPVELSEGVLDLPFQWPTPDWVGTRHAGFFNAYWNLGLSEAARRSTSEDKDRNLEEKLALFLGGLVWAHDEKRKPGDMPAPGDLVWTWRKALKDLSKRHKQLKPASLKLEEEVFLEWLNERLRLLAAPESGLPRKVAEDLWKNLSPELRAPSRKAEAARLKRAELALAKVSSTDASRNARALMSELDRQLMGKPWSTARRPRRRPAPAAVRTARRPRTPPDMHTTH